MNVIIGKNSGFCSGVKYTITKAEEFLKKYHKIDCLGEIIHNKQVVENLEKNGLRTIDSIDDANNMLLIRAHGISKEVYQIAKERNIELIDLTCPKVLAIHKQVEDFANNNYFIFLLGVKNHPETIGTFSYCGKNSYIIESADDIKDAIYFLKSTSLKNILIISQTTFSLSLFDDIVKNILSSLDSSYNIHVEKSICNATNLRQLETEEIAKKVDLMIIIGGKNSSNTKKLYEIANKYCKNNLYIQTKDDLSLDYIKKFENIGIVAGASTPDYIINEIYLSCKNA